MKASDGGIAIGIEDNGIGDSAPSAPDGDTHLGLVSIEQRVLRLGGSLAIDRTPGSFRLGFSFVPRGWRAQ
jgi:signal transduction histidine kinase